MFGIEINLDELVSSGVTLEEANYYNELGYTVQYKYGKIKLTKVVKLNVKEKKA